MTPEQAVELLVTLSGDGKKLATIQGGGYLLCYEPWFKWTGERYEPLGCGTIGVSKGNKPVLEWNIRKGKHLTEKLAEAIAAVVKRGEWDNDWRDPMVPEAEQWEERIKEPRADYGTQLN